jgi:MFS family permease
VYGLGSFITALSPNLTVLLIGWSGTEGLGAVLVIPAIAALTAANYDGKERAFAYSMIGGAAGAAIAAGPLIGGYVTTTWSWRYVFVGEVVVVIAVIAVHRRMKRAPKPEQPPKLDYGGAAFSAIAFSLIVFGILKSSTWGWIRPIDAPTVNGHEVTPLGFSLVPFLIVSGLVVLGCFFEWEEHRERLGRSTLLNRALCGQSSLPRGASKQSHPAARHPLARAWTTPPTRHATSAQLTTSSSAARSNGGGRIGTHRFTIEVPRRCRTNGCAKLEASPA